MVVKSIAEQEEVRTIQFDNIHSAMILDCAFSKGYDAEEIGNTLLDMVDPKRHIHPGIPYDFYDGYIVVIGESGVLPKPASRYACITFLLQKYHSVEIKQNY